MFLIKEASKLSGLSVRTLHDYDNSLLDITYIETTNNKSTAYIKIYKQCFYIFLMYYLFFSKKASTFSKSLILSISIRSFSFKALICISN